MRNIVRIGILIFLLRIPISLFSQDNIMTHDGGLEIPPSPNSMALIKSVERPASLATGTYEVFIPLVDMQEVNGLVGLAYHATGLKVKEKNSSVGLGWSLKAGGLITRYVRGLPDDQENGYLSQSQTTRSIIEKEIDDMTDSNFNGVLENFENRNADGEPDIFYYHFGDYKGKFVLKGDGEVVMIPKNNLKVSYKSSSFGITSFTIVTPNGANYVFDVKEKTTYILSGTLEKSYTSTWHLSSIGTVNEVSTIFEYMAYGSDEMEDHLASEASWYNHSGSYVSLKKNIKYKHSHLRLQRIAGSGNSVYISYNSSILKDFYGTIKRITHRKGRNELKKYEFDYSYFTNTNPAVDEKYRKRIRLDQIRNIEDENTYTYILSYNNTPLPPTNSYEKDFWGYYNGNGATSLLPKLWYHNYAVTVFDPGRTADISGVDRASNVTYTTAGMLTKMESPQGGVTEFTFEPNDFTLNGSVQQGGGLRISSIKQYDKKTPADYKVKSFSYRLNDVANTSSGLLTSLPQHSVIMKQNPFSDSYPNSTNLRYLTYRYARDIEVISARNGYPVYYTEVKVSQPGKGHSVSKFEMPIVYTDWTADNMGYPDLYTSAKSRTIFNTLSDGERYAMVYQKGFALANSVAYDWNLPLLTDLSEFTDNGTIVSSKIFEYYPIELLDKVHALHVLPKIEFTKLEDTGGGGPGGLDGGLDGGPNPGGFFSFTIKRTLNHNAEKYYYLSTWKQLKKKTETIYNTDNANGVTSVEEYAYNSDRFRLMNQIKSIDSKGIERYTKFVFPLDQRFDYDDGGLLEQYEQELLDCIELNGAGFTEPNEDGLQEPSGVVYEDTENSCWQTYENKKAQLGLNSYPDSKAIQTLRERHMINTPIERYEYFKFGTKQQVTVANFYTYQEIANHSVVPLAEYVIDYPVDFSSFQTVSMNSSWLLSKDSHYRKVKSFESYSDQGKLQQYRLEDNIPISTLWSGDGKYALLEGVNATFDQIKNNADEAGDAALRQSLPMARIKRYKHHDAHGLIAETDYRGRYTYYLYNKFGRMLATKDHDYNLQKVFYHHGAGQSNDSYYFDSTTSPDGNGFGEMKVYVADTTVMTWNASITIYGFVNSYQYEVKYGDGTSEWVTDGKIYHKYSSPGIKNIEVSVYNGSDKLWDLYTSTYVKNGSSMRVDFNYFYTENGQNNPFDLGNCSGTCFVDGSYKIEISPKYGSGEYTVKWEIDFSPKELNEPHSPYSNFQEIIATGETSAKSFIDEGRYTIKCTITDGYSSPIVKDFIIEMDRGVSGGN